MNQNDIQKLDVYSLLYTEGPSVFDYKLGKSLTDDQERYVTNAILNPEEDNYINLLYFLINNCKSVDARTLTIDYRLLNNELLIMLEDAYLRGIITGINLYPADAKIPPELISALDDDIFKDFLIVANNVDETSNNLDIRDTKNVCTIEHVKYDDGTKHDEFNIHITRKLTEEEIRTLAGIIKKHDYSSITIDFYEPMYYRKLLTALKKENISSDIDIILLANPLYDEASIYAGLDDIVDNDVIIHYNTCNDLNEYYRDDPHTVCANYYSDIEASGKTTPDNYTSMIEMFDSVIKTVEERGYSPLEKIAYIHDYFKKNYTYNEEYAQEDCDANSKLDRVYGKDRMICEGFSNLYSALLRRTGIMCFTYGTDDHQKNIVRVQDPKYGIDNIAIIDPTWDLGDADNRNIFANFLVPIDNDLYATIAEVINIPTALSINNGTYSTYIEQSNPVYITDPMGYALRMLELMGLGDGGREFQTQEEKINFYKSALANSGLTRRVRDMAIVKAVQHVRQTNNEYSDEQDRLRDLAEIEENVMSRGNEHNITPRIKLFNGEERTTWSYIPKPGISFIETEAQSAKLHRPRKINEGEREGEYHKYLEEFYHKMFYSTVEDLPEEHQEENTVEPEKLENYTVVERIKLFRDTTNPERLFATEDIFQRFNIELGNNIKLPQRENIYELSKRSIDLILNNEENNGISYEVEYEDIDINLFDSTNKNINVNENSEEDLIPGTNFKKPRGRGYYETDEEYVAYLEEYYNSIFPPKKGNEETEELESYTIIERIKLFRDSTNHERIFATEDIFRRFHIELGTNYIKIPQRDDIYELNRESIDLIINGGENNYAPYEIVYEDIDIDLLDVVNKHTNTEEDDLIPGTNFKKPRGRGDYETDEEYVAYLEYYYNSIFPPEKENEDKEIEELLPRPRGIYETDEEYTRYLQDFYGSVPKDELIPGTNFRKPRERGIYETDEEYEEFLEKYYTEIFGEEVVQNSKVR